MPDHRSHRGQHPDDARLFAPDQHASLRTAVAELAWLLSRGYASPSALKLVGDRHRLDARQRMAVQRATCTDEARARRAATRVHAIAGRPLLVDGYNLLTTVEAALSGGVILHARDETYRDVASMHGSYRKVEETGPALTLIGETIAGLKPGVVTWYLDAPVSNSGRLRQLMADHAAARGWAWAVEIVPNPDAVLMAATGCVVATADSVILDAAAAWFNLARYVVESGVPGANVVRLVARGRRECDEEIQDVTGTRILL